MNHLTTMYIAKIEDVTGAWPQSNVPASQRAWMVVARDGTDGPGFTVIEGTGP